MSIFIVVEISIFLTLLRFPSPNVYVGISCCFYCGKNGFIRYLFSNVSTLISSGFSTTRPIFLLVSSLFSPPKQSDHVEKMHNINTVMEAEHNNLLYCTFCSPNLPLEPSSSSSQFSIVIRSLLAMKEAVSEDSRECFLLFLFLFFFFLFLVLLLLYLKAGNNYIMHPTQCNVPMNKFSSHWFLFETHNLHNKCF